MCTSQATLEEYLSVMHLAVKRSYDSEKPEENRKPGVDKGLHLRRATTQAKRFPQQRQTSVANEDTYYASSAFFKTE